MSRKTMTKDEREQRRLQILEAAAGVFAMHGFHCVTTRQIAKAAGVAEGTLYLFFNNKDDILVQMMRELTRSTTISSLGFESLREEPRPALLGLLTSRLETEQRYDHMSAAVLSELLADPELRQTFQQNTLKPLVIELERHLRSRMARGELRPADAALLARILLGAMLGVDVLRWLGDPLIQMQAGRTTDLASLLADVLMDGAAGGK